MFQWNKQWNKTLQMARRLGISDVDKELYQGRYIIHRDSSIDGGIYLGEGQREAIVVDSIDPRVRKLYELAKNRATINGIFIKGKLLRIVYDVVAETMPRQDNYAVKKLVLREGLESDSKVSLGVFLEEGVGVCRHDALACAVLLELFKNEGLIQGKPSVDRNYSIVFGGHAWCRYTNSAEERWILDVRQGYIGRLEDAIPENKWAYQRPDDF